MVIHDPKKKTLPNKLGRQSGTKRSSHYALDSAEHVIFKFEQVFFMTEYLLVYTLLRFH